MRLVLLLFAALAALGTEAAAPAAAAPCSVAEAKAAIIATNVQVPGLAHGTLPVAPDRAGKVICFDFTRDGRTDMAVTVFSGGTAGDIAWIASRRTITRWRVALARAGYKLGLFRVGADLVVSQPVYRNSDPNRCPTGGFDHVRWHWNGRRFVVVRSWHDKRFSP